MSDTHIIIKLSRREAELVAAALDTNELRLNPDDERLMVELRELLERELAPPTAGARR